VAGDYASSKHERIRIHRRFLPRAVYTRLPSSLYDKETPETPEENAKKLREVFEIEIWKRHPRTKPDTKSEKEVMDTSGGRRNMGQGTSPVQSD